MKLHFLPAANCDVRRTVAWYEKEYVGLGAGYLLELEAFAARIERYPEMYPRVLGEVRRAVLKRFPLAIYYRLGHAEAEVLAVAPTAADPHQWMDRVPGAEGNQ